MNYWHILGIEETDDIKKIKKAYAEKSKQCHPETHPEEFKELHRAYKAVTAMVKRGHKPVVTSPSVMGIKLPIMPEVPVVAPLQTHETPLKKTEEGGPGDGIYDKNTKYSDFLEKVYRKYQQKQRALREDSVITEFRKLLYNEENNHVPKLWRNFFAGDGFLEKQYEKEFICEIADILEEYLRASSDRKGRVAGRVPAFVIVYFVVAYGCMFESVGKTIIKEKVWRKEQLEPLKNTLKLQDALFSDYLITEQRDEIVGERFAFYVYRNVLEILDAEYPNKRALKKWLTDGIARENRSHVLELLHEQPFRGNGVLVGGVRRQTDVMKRSPLIFELLEYLLHTNHYNLEVYEDVLKEVCLEGWDFRDCREEKDILVMTIEDNRQKRKC